MKIGKRKNMDGQRGGGGWERPGILSWTREINGKIFQFEAWWDVDIRGLGPDYMFTFQVYVLFDWNGDGSLTYRTFSKWRGVPTGTIDGRTPDLKPVPQYILDIFNGKNFKD